MARAARPTPPTANYGPPTTHTPNRAARSAGTRRADPLDRPTMSHHVDLDDAGKAVIDSNGERVATVELVCDGTPFVRPAPGTDRILTRAMGWHEGHTPHPLKAPFIESVTGGAIYLRSNL